MTPTNRRWRKVDSPTTNAPGPSTAQQLLLLRVDLAGHSRSLEHLAKVFDSIKRPEQADELRAASAAVRRALQAVRDEEAGADS